MGEMYERAHFDAERRTFSAERRKGARC